MKHPTIELYLDIVRKEGITHQLIKKLIFSVFQNYDELRFIKKGCESHRTYKQEKYIELPVNFEDGLSFGKNEDIDIFIEMENKFNDKFLKPDLTIYDKKNKKPLGVIEIVNTSSPNIEKYQAYFLSEINFALINVQDSLPDINEWITDRKDSSSPLIKAYEIYTGTETVFENIKKLLNEQTYNRYKYFGDIKGFEDRPFVFNIEENRGNITNINFCNKTTPYFKSGKITYQNNSKEIPKLTKKIISLVNEMPIKTFIPRSLIEIQDFYILEVKIKKIIKTYGKFLVCELINANRKLPFDLRKYSNIGLIYSNEEEPLPKYIELKESVFFKCNKIFRNERGYINTYANEISSKEEMIGVQANLSQSLNLNYWRLQ